MTSLTPNHANYRSTAEHAGYGTPAPVRERPQTAADRLADALAELRRFVREREDAERRKVERL